MSRKKLFLENMMIYGVFGVLDKIIPFIMLPVITRLLVTPENFSIYSLYSLLVGLGGSIVTIGIYDAMFREYYVLDDIQYKKNVLKTASIMIIFSSIAFFLFGLLFVKSINTLIFNDDKFILVTFLALFTILFNGIKMPFFAPVRLLNKRKEYVFTNIAYSLVIYVIGLILIIIGYSYYGIIYSTLIATLLLFIYFFMFHRDHQRNGVFTKSIAISLLLIGLPLVPNLLVYWIYESFDKLMITRLIGNSEMGIYSVAGKFSKISHLIHIAFAGGWQFFAFSTMNDTDQVKLNSRVYEIFLVITIVIFSSFMLVFRFAFELLFEASYYSGIASVPYLFLSPLILILIQISGNQFIITKKSYLIVVILFLGAGLNILLNFVLIPIMGITGAAIATFSGYVLSLIITLFTLKHRKLIESSKNIGFLYAITTLTIVVLIMTNGMNFLVNAVLFFINILIVINLYKKEILIISKKILKKR